MTAANYSLRLLPSLKSAAEKIAKAEGTSLNQLINLALAEKVAALTTATYFQERSRKASVADFQRVLTGAPDVEPEPWDRL